jgi:hypothetical protein
MRRATKAAYPMHLDAVDVLSAGEASPPHGDDIDLVSDPHQFPG